MPLALVVIAWILIMTGINGNYAALGQQFNNDVLGQGGFFNFLVGIVGIAVFFRVVDMPNAGRVFIGLVILAYLLQNANVLTSLESVGTGVAPGGGTAAAAPVGDNSAALAAAATIPTTGIPGSTPTGTSK